MPNDLSYANNFPYITWGSTFAEVVNITALDKVFICHAQIGDLTKVASELANDVFEQNWILGLDTTARRAYEATATRTAKELVEIFNKTISNNSVTSEFGELMVSMGASKALEIVFKHRCIPLAELWKPKLSQNEGFDFHTVCPNSLINFGEAKFSSNASPYGGTSGESSGAGGQADGFIAASKHLMDGIHLQHLAAEGMSYLNTDQFGVVLAFSINAANPLLILKNALEQSETYDNLKAAKNIYIVGVSHESQGY